MTFTATTALGFTMNIVTSPTTGQVNTGTLINASGSYSFAKNDPGVTGVECYFIHGAPAPIGFPGAMVTGTVTDQNPAYLLPGNSYSLQKKGQPDLRLKATKTAGGDLSPYYVVAIPFGANHWYQDAAKGYWNPSQGTYSFP